MKKRLLAMIMTLAMCLSLLPTAAFATGTSSAELQAGEVRASKALVLDENGNPAVDSDGYYTVQITVQGKPVTTEKAADVIVCIDVSNSMTGEDDDGDGYVVRPGKVCNGRITEDWKDQGEWKHNGFFWYWDSDRVLVGYHCSSCGYKWDLNDTRPSNNRCDQGGSEGVTRLDIAKQASVKFAQDLLGEGMDINMAVVAFGGKAGGVDDEYLATTSLTNTESTIISFVNGLVTPEQTNDASAGGTNYTSALDAAKDILDSRSDKTRDAYILFLSDGKPAYMDDESDSPNWNGTSQASTLIDAGVTIYTGGIAISDSDKGPLVAISSTKDSQKLYKAISRENMADDLASLMNVVKEAAFAAAGKNAVITDVINTAEFDYKPVTTENVTDSSGTLTWNIGDITETQQSIQFKVKPKAGKAGDLYTNDKITLTYTNPQNNLVTIEDTKEEAPKDIQIGNPYITVQPSTFVVKYEYTGDFPAGAPEVPADATVAVGTEVSVEDAPTLTGYTFSGWSTEDADVNDGKFSMPAKDVKLTGFWSVNTDTKYTVEHYKQDLDETYPTTASESEPKTGTTGEKTAAAAKTYEGFTAKSFEQAVIKGDGTTVVKIYYDRNSYKVTYKYEGTVPADASGLPADATYKYGAAVDVADDPADVPGYTFSGWSTTDVAVNEGSFNMPAKVVELIGSWNANTNTAYKVEHYKQNQAGNGYDLEETENKTGTTGATATATPKEYTGFTFDETVTGTLKSAPILANGSLVLKLYYTRNSYEVTFDANGGAWNAPVDGYTMNEGKTTASIVYHYNDTVAKIAPAPTQSGKVFNGWFLKIPGTTEGDFEKYPVTVWNGSTPKVQAVIECGGVFYADWADAPVDSLTYTVRQHYIGADGKEVAAVNAIDQTADENTAISSLISSLESNQTYYGQNYVYVANETTVNSVAYQSDMKLTQSGTVIDLYYYLDEWNDKDDVLKGGDNTPDYQQAVVTFRANPNGSVGKDKEKTTQVYTLDKGEDNKYSKNETPATVTPVPNEGFAFELWTKNEGETRVDPFVEQTLNGGEVVTYVAHFAVDVKGDPTDPENKGDDVPDKYQKKVTFKVVNGKWNNETNADVIKYVTLTKDGQWAVDGTYTVTEADVAAIPAVGEKPDSGYKAGSWDTLYKADDIISADVTYTYTYAQKGGNGGGTHIPDNPPALNKVDHFAYIVGYPDGNVEPQGNITRAEVATIFFRMLTDESRAEFWSQSNDYSDVTATKWFNNAVSTLSNGGIITGYNDGTFKPNGNITRAEFATMAVRFFSASYEGEDLFPDIDKHWAKAYINTAAYEGIINGYEDGTFRPDQYITRAEAMTIVNRVLDRHPDKDNLLEDMIQWPDNMDTEKWYYADVQEATNSHDYDMEGTEAEPYEVWTEILPVRDWVALEKEWSDSNSAPGGEVMN